MSEKIAKEITIEELNKNFRGTAKLFKLTPELVTEKFDFETDEYKEHKVEFVIVSATVAFGSGPETYIFEANSKGEVLSWTELPGSYRGRLDHEEALSNIDYII